MAEQTKKTKTKSQQTQNDVVKEVETKEVKPAETTEPTTVMTDREKELREKYQNKYIKNTKKDKGMGTMFWVLVGACVACLVFIATVIIVRSV